MADQKSFPKFSENAIRYAWRQLAQRVGLAPIIPDGNGFESLDLEVNYGLPRKQRTDRPRVNVIPARPGAWESLLDLQKGDILYLPAERVFSWRAAPPFFQQLPVIMWGEGYEDGQMPFAADNGGGEVIVYADIISSTLFMLTRWEELVVPERDLHERFPASASLAYKQGFLDRPVVDEYAFILRSYIQRIFPGWQPSRRKYQLILSHDIDSIRSFRNHISGIKSIAGDLIKRRDFRQGLLRAGNIVKDSISPEQAANYQGISKLAQVSLENGLSGTFFFLAGSKSNLDSDFKIDSKIIKQSINQLQSNGFQIGIHPSYHTYNDLDRLLEEKALLEKTLGRPVREGRQHYLRFQTPVTWRLYEQVGLQVDSSLTYAGHEGFRAGTCHPFNPFDLQQDRELNLTELPLVVMDGTLRQYRALSIEEAEKSIINLAEKCRNVEGSFTLLWHNSSIHGEWAQWFEMYRRVLPRLT